MIFLVTGSRIVWHRLLPRSVHQLARMAAVKNSRSNSPCSRQNSFTAPPEYYKIVM
jgi:hypothetical protein